MALPVPVPVPLHRLRWATWFTLAAAGAGLLGVVYMLATRRTAVTPLLTLEQLLALMPRLAQAKAREYLPHLVDAMAEADITTPRRIAAFLAQLAHESGELKYMEELASGAAYEGRADLGNTRQGDGVRFKGRGPIQLTGRTNYTRAGDALGVDLVDEPERAAAPDVAFRTASWYWTSRNLNRYADAGDFDAITYRVNGGYNGKASRDAYYARALLQLGGTA